MALRATNAHYAFHTIQARHWHAHAMKHGGRPVWDALLAMIENVEAALARVEMQLPAEFPARTWDRIASGMRSQARRFDTGVAAIAQTP